ncbi:MAG: hypothetical protein AAF909_09120 [Pseudomonadota bacterium]
MSTAFRVERGGRVVVAYQQGAHREARRIARMIDGYRPPAPLLDRENAFGFTPEQFEGVVSAPPADPSAMDLPSADRYRLREADHLIAACSGDAAEDRWLDEAIRTFLAHKSGADKGRRLHVVLIPGPSPRWRRSAARHTDEAKAAGAPALENAASPNAAMGAQPDAETDGSTTERPSAEAEAEAAMAAADAAAETRDRTSDETPDGTNGDETSHGTGDDTGASAIADDGDHGENRDEPQSPSTPDAARELGVGPIADLSVDKDGWRGGGRLIRAAVLGVPPAQLHLMERERQTSRLRIGVITVLVTSVIGLTAVVVGAGG